MTEGHGEGPRSLPVGPTAEKAGLVVAIIISGLILAILGTATAVLIQHMMGTCS